MKRRRFQPIPKRPTNPDYVVYIDGAAYPNPSGAIGMGVIIRDKEGNLITEMSDYEPKHPDHSNNVAEYIALLMVLEYLDIKQFNDVVMIVHSDSSMLVQQMNGEMGMKEGRYFEVANRCKILIKRFKEIYFQWIPREFNIEADALSKRGFEAAIPR